MEYDGVLWPALLARRDSGAQSYLSYRHCLHQGIPASSSSRPPRFYVNCAVALSRRVRYHRRVVVGRGVPIPNSKPATLAADDIGDGRRCGLRSLPVWKAAEAGSRTHERNTRWTAGRGRGPRACSRTRVLAIARTITRIWCAHSKGPGCGAVATPGCLPGPGASAAIAYSLWLVRSLPGEPTQRVQPRHDSPPPRRSNVPVLVCGGNASGACRLIPEFPR